ncbi:exoribonuclease II [Enterobacteriaceae endosymbiont of Donacia bicoloricornis]|uniref:exoribonuclease II n=1 Tax=Enterobacteriaceae endosymbiont of Donacia bicoloricornis TaxID=2675772 RepID=UPI001448CE5B|nr:exoribonuclease II [Enterobacteriaceae endosymbiont of Donacia bicoloricornis]QJC37567.1 exoribonuclease II [Enterobacteriaceae endosymbiont of Donacia bicoloricornis]
MLYNNILLFKLKKKFSKNLPSIKGFVKILNKNTVILETDENNMYHISYIYLKYVMDGDYILANIKNDINNKLNVIPIKLIKSSINIFEGIIKKNINNIYIIPKKKFLFNNIIKCVIGKNIKNNFKNGDKVIAKIIQHPLKKNNNSFVAEITEILTINNKHLKPWWEILLKYNLEINSPSNDLCKKIEFLDENINRHDLTKLCFITIDSKETKDIDDALYIEEISEEELLIYIAIADPTSYIKKDSKIDQIASERMFTNYLPGLTISLLPKKLSENFCSLHPNKKRPVLICKIKINKNGLLNKKIIFFTGWIKSKAKLNYNDVSDWLEKKGTWKPNNSQIKKQIFLLYKFYLYRKKWNDKNTVKFNNQDYKFMIDNQGNILDIIIEKRRIAHKIIETAMITANICASEILYKHLDFGVYNIYYGFNINKIDKIKELLNESNIRYNKSFLMTLTGYKTLYNQLQDSKSSFILNRIKKYQLITFFNIKPGPHFSLGLKRYATWTSPIRKFGDMINHRLIKSIINKKYNILKPLNDIYINMNQKRYLYKQAQKDLYNFLYLQYFQNIYTRNKIFISEIIDILYNGIKIRFLENGAYAFIPKKFLNKNLIFKQEKGIILNKNKLFFKVTDKIKVIIKKININGIIAKLVN